MSLEIATSPAAAAASTSFVVHYHIDIVDRHESSPALACVTGWISAEQGFDIRALGLCIDRNAAVRCHYPFHQGDVPGDIVRNGARAFTNFCVFLPKRLDLRGERLVFAAMIAPEGGDPKPWRLDLAAAVGHTRQVRVSPAQRLESPPTFVAIDASEGGALIESRLFDHLARQRFLTLRLDLINKCNLRCVMCHYSNNEIAKRPASSISPGQFSAFYDPIAPTVRDVVLSCGDEPLMSPHFEQILGELAARDPEVRVRFCTNAMLLNARIAEAIIAARTYLVMFSFDGVLSETLHRIRVGSNYRRIVENILRLKRLRMESGRENPRFVFNFVMLASNVHEAPRFVRLAKRLGGDYIDFRLVVPGDVYDIGSEMLERCPQKFDYYRERILAAAAGQGIEVLIPPAFGAPGKHNPLGDPPCSLEEFESLLRELGEDPSRDPEKARKPEAIVPEHIYEAAHAYCDRPFSEVMIRDQRDVYPCPWHKEKLGELGGSSSLKDIFFGEKFRRLRLAMFDPKGAPACAGCPVKSHHLPTRIL